VKTEGLVATVSKGPPGSQERKAGKKRGSSVAKRDISLRSHSTKGESNHGVGRVVEEVEAGKGGMDRSQVSHKGDEEIRRRGGDALFPIEKERKEKKT